MDLDRPRLLAQLAEFLATSHATTLTPELAEASPRRSAEIPLALRDLSNDAAPDIVRMTGVEAEQYAAIQEHLGALRETEWLRTEDLDELLWTLACQLAMSPGEFAAPAQRQGKAEEFLARVLRQLRPYEVIVTVDHIKPPSTPVAVWDAQLTTATLELLRPFVERLDPDWQESLREPFLGKTVIRVEVQGTAASPVTERARALAHHRLHVLRSGLASQWQTAPAQLRFRLGQDTLARALIGEPDGWRTTKRPPATPVDLEFHVGHNERLGELRGLRDNLTKAHPSVSPVIENACEWIGRGLCRHWPGDALRDYTTAIEVLVILTKTERKSVLVPYRMLALADLHGESMIHPLAIRHAYDRRSTVVHQGQLGAGDEQATRRMLSAARDCARWLARYGADHPDQDRAALLISLDTAPLRRGAKEWLEKFPGPWTEMLIRGIESSPQL